MKRPINKIPVFTRKQRKGVLALACLVVILQLGYFIYNNIKVNESQVLSQSDLKWLNQQIVLDSIQKTDSLATSKIYPFNPNFISDFKGYQLGMTVEQIDKLHQYRSQNKYVNSASEFQKVTGISDSLLRIIQPYFKFPEWTQKNDALSHKDKQPPKNQFKKNETYVLKDINKADATDLQMLNGIGEVLSQRILDERNKYSAFVSWEQFELIYGLRPEVIRNLQKHFIIDDLSGIKKLNINNASIQEISKLPYIKYSLAKEIVIYRSKFGDFNSITDFNSIENFPHDKAQIIEYYIKFK